MFTYLISFFKYTIYVLKFFFVNDDGLASHTLFKVPNKLNIDVPITYY